MPKIQALTDSVINQIAAGEVIERPASVVKELVENALDAGASEIRITIEGGGKMLIRIVDNGCGMTRDDLEMCPLRHTTSKLRSVDDLIRIGTNGFRGEAVASIASISKLRIETRVANEDAGNVIELEGGTINNRETIARPIGTQFIIQDLFFNTPVRRTFLGSDALETSKISDVVTRIALAHPDKRIELKQGARELFVGAAGSARTRLADVLGVGLAKEMTEFDYTEAGIRVHGFAAPPDETRGRRNLQYFFLGTRPIYNNVIAKAVQRAYEPYGKGGYPVIVLFLEMNGAEFDVNVHPAKREVRFSNENAVFLAVHHAVRESLMGPCPVVSLANFATQSEEKESQPEFVTTPKTDSHYRLSTSSITSNTPIAKEVPKFVALAPVAQNVSAPEPPKWEAKNSFRSSEPQDLFSQPEYGKVVQLSPKLFQRPIETKPTIPESSTQIRFFQWAQTYVVCEDSQGLLVIDQNAASQRILYERALKALDVGKTVEAQELLFPEVIELTRAEGILLQEHLQDLDKLGFHMEPFGGGSWQMRGIPVHLPVSRAELALRDFLRNLTDANLGEMGPREVLAKAFASGSALQAGITLGNEEMAAMLDQLVLTSDPFVSPLGRPCLLRLPLDEIHRRFKRAE